MLNLIQKKICNILYNNNIVFSNLKKMQFSKIVKIYLIDSIL